MLETIDVTIHGMTCAMCQITIEEGLSSLEGVQSIHVSLVRKNAEITYDTNKVTLHQLKEVTASLGYELTYSNGNDNCEDTNENHNIHNGDSKNILSTIWFYSKTLAIIGSLAILYDNIIGFENLMLVKQDMSFGMVFVVGLITSIHCVTMCGGIGLSLSLHTHNKSKTWKQRMLPNLQYQLGRLVSYTLLGAVIGGLGSVVSLSASGKSLLTLIAGVFMIAMALRMMGIADAFTGVLYSVLPRLPKKTQGWMRKQKRGKAPFVVGLVNGLMPCGPLQAMQIYALQTGSMFYGGLSMFLFSLGTIPLMVAFSALGTLRNKTLTNNIYRIGALVVMILGFTMTNRALLLRGIDVVGKLEQKLGITSQEVLIAQPQGNMQEVTMNLQSGSYPDIKVQSNVSTTWVIEVEDKHLNGCNNEIVIPALGKRVTLHTGVNEMELPPMEAGQYVYTCWMGMISGQITIM